MLMPHVEDLEARFLPWFRDAAEQLRLQFPNYKFMVWSSSVGGATTYQGHNLGVECLFPDAADHEADCVAAYVGVKHLTTEPQLAAVCVEWGNGQHPDVRVEFVEDDTPLDSQSMDEAASRLPELLRVFRAAVDAWLSRGRD
jgi:hypothetical protein